MKALSILLFHFWVKSDRLLAAQFHHGDARRTFDEVVEAWVPWVERQVGESTAKRYACSLGMLETFVAGKFLDEIDGRLVADIIRDRRTEGDVTNATINRDLTALSSVLEFAIAQEWREDNPTLAKRRLTRESRDPIALPKDQDVAKIVARAPGLLDKMIMGARVTGARLDELASAQTSQLDLKGRRLTLIGKGSKGRGKKLRVISLEPMGGVELFASLPLSSPKAPLFWHGEAESYKNLSSRFAFLCRELAELDGDFTPFPFHNLRHLHAVEYLRDGWGDIYALQQRLGHSSVKVTEGYLKFLTDDEVMHAKHGGRRNGR